MKKFLLLLLVASFTFGYFQAKSQCTPAAGGPGACSISAGQIESVATKIETIGSNCVTTINVSFNLGHNNGLKWVPLYFYDNVIPSGVCGTTPNSTTGLLGFALLQYVGANTFNISNQSVGTLTPQTGYSVSATAITGGSRITITGLKVTKSGACATSRTALYIGAENADNPGVKCYASNSFTAYQLISSGRVNCTVPRTYTLNVNTDYRVSGTPTSITGKYDVYYDLNNNGLIDDGVSGELAMNVDFVTVVQNVEGIDFNSFSSTQPFASSSLGDPKTGTNLLVVIRPDPSDIADSRTRLANSCGILPVKLKSFNASKQSSKVLVTWETTDEINSKGFEVQRRVNNGAYETIGFVASKAGNSGSATYQFEDQSRLPQGSLYYRLRQIDNDDQARYSDIRLVMNSTRKLDVSVYPNPSKGAATVILPESNGKMDITLEDYTGRMLQRWNAFSSSNLQLNQLRPGIYLIRVLLKETGEQSVQRLLVQ